MKRIMVRRGLKAAFAFLALIAFLGPSTCSAHSPTVAQSPTVDATNVVNSSRLVSVTSSEGRVTWHEDFNDGWRVARESGRPMVIYITSQRCRYCEAMKRDTWRNGSILKRVKDGFVAIRLSPERNSEVLKRIKVPAYPMTLIGHPKGRILAHKVGYQPPSQMHQLLGAIEKPMP